jgi:hypothetical protein
MIGRGLFLVAAVCILLSGCAAPVRPELVGTPVAAAPAQRIVTITPATRWVNVTSGETVRFVIGAQGFAWSFQSGPTVSKFDLNVIAPPGMLTHPVTVYVAANPTYISNS